MPTVAVARGSFLIGATTARFNALREPFALPIRAGGLEGVHPPPLEYLVRLRRRRLLFDRLLPIAATDLATPSIGAAISRTLGRGAVSISCTCRRAVVVSRGVVCFAYILHPFL